MTGENGRGLPSHMTAPSLAYRRRLAAGASCAAVVCILPRCQKCGSLTITEARLTLGIRRHLCQSCKNVFASVETTTEELVGNPHTAPTWAPWLASEGIEADTSSWAASVLEDHQARVFVSRMARAVEDDTPVSADDVTRLREVAAAGAWRDLA